MFYPTLIGSNTMGAYQSNLAQTTADQARRKADAVEEQLERVKCDVERLLMITEALWTVLKKDHGYSDDVLKQLVADIDLRDGKLDGRVAGGPPIPCPYCGHMLPKQRPFCIYCGKPVQPEPFAR